ncbi:hypothetical protein BRYFOR_05095 [Marvinbryantia formatexigens DSM 14469]|uniref:Uncharacterized protein n=1 Tax=Marvinbryantia formatexigens DSM 14469 TaxID=478749 RepID=C6L905_9FIRM|nr:hypothetical protein BRYFOR_05095 [Marvinbryantia formatexigens DSM 14469]
MRFGFDEISICHFCTILKEQFFPFYAFSQYYHGFCLKSFVLSVQNCHIS